MQGGNELVIFVYSFTSNALLMQNIWFFQSHIGSCRFLGLITLLVLSFGLQAQQQILVEEVLLESTISAGDFSKIPRLRDPSDPNNPMVQKINAVILDQLMIESYEQSEVVDFRYFEMSFESEVNSEMVYIHYSGEYLGAYPSPVENELLFDLKTGTILKSHPIPFHALFTLHGYFDFMEKHWLPKAKTLMEEALECADSMDPFCSLYDVSNYNSSETGFLITGDFSCFPHVNRACNPYLELTMTETDLTPYLSDFGKQVWLTDQYNNLKGLDKYLYAQKARANMPIHILLMGKIDGKYPISMALQYEPQSGKLEGYYYYNNKKLDIALLGGASGSESQLTEQVDGKVTGHFEFNWETEYAENGYLYAPNDQYLIANWYNADRSKKLALEIADLKITR